MSAPPFSPALRFKARKQAERRQEVFYEALKALQAPVIHPSTKDYAVFEQLKAALEKDVNHVKSLGKGDAKRDHIREQLIPRYTPHLKSYRKQEEIYANPILVWMVIWFFDVGEIQQAFDYGMLAIEENQLTPFKRDMRTLFTDELRQWAEKANTPEEKQQAIYFLLKAFTPIREWPIKDDAKMNYLKTLGKLFDGLGGKENELKALALYQEAMSVGKAQCKTRIDQLNKLYGSPPTEGILLSLSEDSGLPNQDKQESPSTSNKENS